MNLTITNNTADKAYFIVWGFGNNTSIDNAPWSYLVEDGANASKLAALPTPPSQTKDAVKNNVDLLQELAPGKSMEFKNIPQIISGNILLTFKERPKLFSTVPAWGPDGKTPISEHKGWGVQSPGFNKGDQDANTVFCSSEFTLNDSGVWADTTTVDYFAAPVTVTVNGSAGNQTSGTLNKGVTRDDVFAAFTGIKGDHLAGFNKLRMQNDGKNVRVLAPGHVVPTSIPANYYDKYVKHCMGMYTTKDSLTVNVGGAFAGTYLGTTNESNNTITFVNKDNKASVGLIKIPPGNAESIFLCNGVLSAPNTLLGAITAVVCAALNRTVLHQNAVQPYCNSADFYNTKDESKDWWATNWYSKLLHDKISKVYGFAFDDVCNNGNYKPLIHDPKPTSVSISLDKWS